MIKFTVSVILFHTSLITPDVWDNNSLEINLLKKQIVSLFLCYL